ncbi:hypothetical protein C8F01DRAFT_1371762 [Mycena amicta]|nr:hypothetical protein C8F01DRAFT_1371762 [Mycena amicta]
MSANSELQSILAAALSPYKSHQSRLEAVDTMLYILKAERNSLAPSIHTLPNEIIAQIFRWAGYWRPPGTSLLLVCQRWKEIAIHSPELYSTLTFLDEVGHVRFFEQLKRSGDAPLRVNIGRLKDTDSELIDSLMANAHRLAQLEIYGEVEYMLEFMQRLVENSFPLLCDLRMAVTMEREDHDQGDIASIPLLPSAVLDGRIPNLHSIELVAIEPPWTAIHSLRYLRVTSRNAPLTHPLELQSLLALLSACPELIELDITVAISPGRRNAYPTIRLPQLERLTLREKSRTLQDFLHFVLVPATTCLDLHAVDVNSGADIRDLLVPIRKHLRAPGALQPSCITFAVPGRNTNVPAKHFRIDLDHKPLGYGRNTSLFSIISHPASGPFLKQILVKILHAVPTASITQLVIEDWDYSGPGYLSKAEWRVALPLLPALELVDLCGADTGGRTFFEALADTMVRPEAEVPFWLRTVKVRFHIRDLEGVARAQTFVEHFKRMLRGYIAAGRRLQYATFELMSINEGRAMLTQNWDELRTLVDKLDFTETSHPLY